MLVRKTQYVPRRHPRRSAAVGCAVCHAAVPRPTSVDSEARFGQSLCRESMAHPSRIGWVIFYSLLRRPHSCQNVAAAAQDIASLTAKLNLAI